MVFEDSMKIKDSPVIGRREDRVLRNSKVSVRTEKAPSEALSNRAFQSVVFNSGQKMVL